MNLIDKAKAALEGATEGPWCLVPGDAIKTCGVDGPNGEAVVWSAHRDDEDGIQNDHDAALFALAHETTKALIAAEAVVHSVLRSDPWEEIDARIKEYGRLTEGGD